ncbi:hypothetical protein OESDEN_15183 [Oesophagostomum dentatum]|uniref:Uncharacterized protein n=1 Tax=Oesophagostomum dentatum TaxID=61180 RepID=A0A0B1SMJ2_OESDE|nr:hypothetical protein OESDEN_15183 [Oesophagostomum dentatum]
MALTTGFLILNMAASFSDTFLPPNPGPRPDMTDPKKRIDKNSPYFKQLVVAASSEWAMVLVMQLFVLSLVVEMNTVRASGPRIIVEEKDECDGNIAF